MTKMCKSLIKVSDKTIQTNPLVSYNKLYEEVTAIYVLLLDV